MITQNKRFMVIMVSVAIVLLIPLIAMQFTNEVNWTLPDFVIAGVLLLGTGLLCNLVIRNVKKKESRIAICIVVIAIFLLIWAELAVGIFGTPLAGS